MRRLSLFRRRASGGPPSPKAKPKPKSRSGTPPPPPQTTTTGSPPRGSFARRVPSAQTSGELPSALVEAIRAGDAAATLAALENPQATDHAGDTPLHYAAREGHVACIEATLSTQTIDKTNARGRTPLLLAAERGHTAAVEALIDAGASPAAVDDYGHTALHRAALRGHVDSVRLLTTAGVNVDSTDTKGLSALHLASRNGNAEMAALLLSHGADARLGDRSGKTPLILAAQQGRSEVVYLLLDAHAAVDARDSKGTTALHAAATRGHADVVRALVADAAADVNATDGSEKTPLHVAAAAGETQVVMLLVEAGADTEAHDNLGYTGLHWAARKGSVPVAQELLRGHADPAAISNEGVTPLKLARRYHHDDIAALLRQHGAGGEGGDGESTISDDSTSTASSFGGLHPRPRPRRRPRVPRTQSSKVLRLLSENKLLSESSEVQMPHADLRRATNDFAPAQLLGRGWNCDTYAGELYELPVVVKVMHRCEAQPGAFPTMVRRLAQCSHPCLMQLLGHSTDGPAPLLVFSRLAGGTLAERLRGEPALTWAQRLNIAMDVARGVAYLHSVAEVPFVHRNLTSNNVLLDEDLNARVSDHGIVTEWPPLNLGEHGHVNGAVNVSHRTVHLSPEYLQGELTSKLDSFSYGVLLLELLTGQPPTDPERQPHSIVLALHDFIARDVGNVSRVLDPRCQFPLAGATDLAALALRCLDPSAAARPTLVEVVTAVEKLISGDVVSPPRPPATVDDVPRSFVRSHCVICLEARADMAIVPCGHRCVCETDAQELIARNESCPICRCAVVAVMKIFE